VALFFGRRLFTHNFFASLFASQKWSKGKVREKLNNLVCFDQATYDRMMKEVSAKPSCLETDTRYLLFGS